MRSEASRVFRLAFAVGVMTSSAAAETVAIRFSDLHELARTQSPGAALIAQELEHTRARRDRDLQWSNPEFTYDREAVDDLDEYQLTIGKRFEVPWAYLKRRSAWATRVESAELQAAASTRQHLAELKTGYARLQLLDQYLARLGRLRGILTDASHVARARHSEGQLSGVEDHLIQMSVISLNATYHAALQQRREAAAQWHAAIGMEPGDSLSLRTPVHYRPVQLEPAEYYADLIESQPGYRSQKLLEESLARHAAAERGRFIPSFTVYGGYKKIEPQYKGYVAGFSIDLPLFHVNRAAAREYDARSRIVAVEARMSRSRAAARAVALVRSIADANLPLASVADHFEESSEAFNNLLFSYEEGWMTLSELLNGIQIEWTGLRDYFEQLSLYYENIFTLEALTGQTLVRFTP